MNIDIPETVFFNRAMGSTTIPAPVFGQTIAWPSIEEVRRNTNYRPPVNPAGPFGTDRYATYPVPAHAQAIPQPCKSTYNGVLYCYIEFTWPMNDQERDAQTAIYLTQERIKNQKAELARQSVAGRYSKEIKTKLSNIKDKNPEQFKTLLRDLGVQVKED